MSGEGKVVCVTGASGFIASWLVKFLLERGYIVKATVRNPDYPKKVEHLLALHGVKERLHLVKADLLEEGSFDAAVEGCEGVFHTASPFYNDPKDPQAELLDPAVKGTLNVLNSCAKFPSIKRVILTSSMAAVVFNKRPKTPEVVVDESWYSDLDLCRELQAWYVLSKTMAEDAAWKFVQERGIDMVTINPGLVSGPLLQPTLNTSAAIVANLFNGAETYPNAAFGWVDVRNVVTAHILAFETPSAHGRYCLVESTVHFSELVKMLKDHYPNAPLPQKCADNNPSTQTYQISYHKTKSLGVEYIPLKASLRDTIESLKKKGFVNNCDQIRSSL